MKRLGVALLSGGVLCLASPTQAALSEADFLADLPVVLSPSRLPQPLADSPSSVTVIDREMIRASGFTQVADLFRLVPGFSVAYGSSLLPTMTYHGLGDGYQRRFQVLIDGRSVYSPDFGQVSWRNLPLALDDIERIEVIRGPAGASYGANAFMGVINITTRSGELGRSYAEVAVGDHGQRLVNARLNGKAGGFDWRLSAGQKQDDGLDYSDPDDVRERYADWKSEWQLNDAHSLSMQAGIAHTRQETSFTPYNQHHAYASLGWRYVQSASSEFSVNYNVTQETLSDKPGIDLSYRTLRHNIGGQWNGRLAENFRTALGAEFRHDTVQSDFYYNQPQAISEHSWRVFGNGEWSINPQWLVNVGGMVEHTHTDENQFSPRVTLNYKPSREQAFRLEYNRAYRVPTLYELFGQNQFFGDWLTILPDGLKAEQVVSRGLGWLVQMPQAGLQMDTRLFYDTYNDLINFTLVPNGVDEAYQFFNAGKATLKGIEFQIEWRPVSSTRIRLTPAWVKISSKDSTIEDSAPPFSISLLLDHKINANWRASAGYYHSGAMTWLGAGGRVDAASRLDARIAYQTKVGGHPLELWLTGQSLLGDQDEFVPDQQFDRRFMLGVRTDW